MDHESAVKSQACEKYLLGELSPGLREAYEEHFFSCAECATQVRMTAEMVGAGQRVFMESPAAELQPGGTTEQALGWSRWLRPAFAMPVLAALLFVIGYQNLVMIPRLQRSQTPRVVRMFSLISANTRGETVPLFTAQPSEPVGLYVDVPADPAYSSYELSLQDPSGKTTLLRSLSYAETQKTQVVVVNPEKVAGRYVLVITGQASGPSASAELARIQFNIAFTGQILQH